MNTRSPRKTTRTAFAATIALTLVLALSVFGGVGLAKNPGAAQKQYEKKVTLCHKGKKTIRVSKNAVKAHLKHGDTLGACANSSKAKGKKGQQSAKSKKAKGQEQGKPKPKGGGKGK